MDRRGDEVRRRAGRSGAKTSKEGRRAKDMPGDAHAEGAEFRSRRGRSRESPPWLFLRFQESGRPSDLKIQIYIIFQEYFIGLPMIYFNFLNALIIQRSTKCHLLFQIFILLALI